METNLMSIAVTIAIGGILILIAIALKGIIDHFSAQPADSQPPAVHLLFAALTPWLYTAIHAGQTFALKGLSELGAELSASDRKAIADRVWNILPPTLEVAGVPLPIANIKNIVGKERFEQWVNQVYEEAQATILKNEAYLTAGIEAFAPAFIQTSPTVASVASGVTLTDKSDTVSVNGVTYNAIDFLKSNFGSGGVGQVVLNNNSDPNTPPTTQPTV